MSERMPPEGQPETSEGASPEPEAPSSGPIGWPEQPAAAEAPTEAIAPPAAPPPAQPAVQWQAPAPMAAVAGARAPRTTLSAAGGVVLLALGIVGLLFGVLGLASAALISQLLRDYTGNEIPDFGNGVTAGGIVGGVVAFFAILVIAYSVAYVLGGIGVLRSAEWGRWLGIVVSVISGLIWATGLNGATDGFGFSLVMFLVHLYVFFVLVFRWREPVPPGMAMPPA